MAATNLTDALIGHTGFVGGTLHRQRDFAALFNSRNIEAIKGGRFGSVVCAGVSAVKWLANKEPDADWAGIRRLMDCLDEVSARHFVLISTIDVYRDPVGPTERDLPPTDGLHAYGRHRLALEAFVAQRFASHSIVRLPALFGAGLKKNALFDLMHLNQVDRIVPNAMFQWYPLGRFARDLDLITDAGVKLINITAEPVSMQDVRARFFPDVPIGPPIETPPIYDVRSVHDALLGGHHGYHLNAAQVWQAMGTFVTNPAEQ
jgi:nucleoside-diphosphate-sugar epimerase